MKANEIMANIDLPAPTDTPESLWPEDFGPRQKLLPEELLRQQGDVLKQITNGKVEGAMAIMYGSMGSTTYWEGDFYLVSPATGYRYRLLSIRFDPVPIFPVTIETEAVAERKLEAQNEAEYRDCLRKIFHSDDTKRVVRFIMESLDDFESPS